MDVCYYPRLILNNSLLYIARVMFYLEDSKFCLPLEEVMKCENYHIE